MVTKIFRVNLAYHFLVLLSANTALTLPSKTFPPSDELKEKY